MGVTLYVLKYTFIKKLKNIPIIYHNVYRYFFNKSYNYNFIWISIDISVHIDTRILVKLSSSALILNPYYFSSIMPCTPN